MPAVSLAAASPIEEDVLSALVNLGYHRTEAEKALLAARSGNAAQSFDVLFRAPRFDATGKKIENARFIKVTHNGQIIQENVEVPRPTCAAHWLDEKPTGPLMLQGDHGPVAYRNLRLKAVP